MRIIGVVSTQTSLRDIAVGNPFIYQSVLFMKILGVTSSANVVNMSTGMISYVHPDTAVAPIDAHIRYGKE